MSTLGLTPLQQKLSLSAKKKSKKRTIRNILASPFASYWPVIKREDASILNEVLQASLPKVQQPKVKIPWSELKTIPREKRKEFRLKYNKTEPVDKSYSSHVVFGVNQTTNLLETNTASTVLISDHVEPKFMVKHIFDMAVLRNVPILILPHLNNLLEEQVGISSIAIGLKVNPTMASNYSVIDQKIKEIALNYPPPSKHINFHRRGDAHEEESLEASDNESLMDVNESSDEELHPPRNLYLYRKSKSQRVFVPELSKPQESVTLIDKIEIDSSGFLAFGDSEQRKSPVKDNSEHHINQKPKTKAKVSYKSLIIKRITNNKERGQKKIEMLKRKK